MQECVTAVSKCCCTCRIDKPLSRFYKSKKSRDGHGAKCIDCTLEHNRNYYAKNTERLRAYGRQYYVDHIEDRKQYSLDFYNKNREYCLAQNKQWHIDNAERSRSVDALYKRENADKVRIWNGRRRALKAEVSIVPFTAEQLAEKWAYWGDKCWMCGDAATQTDHVKPINKGGLHVLANMRPACRSCNASKHDTWPYPVRAR